MIFKKRLFFILLLATVIANSGCVFDKQMKLFDHIRLGNYSKFSKALDPNSVDKPFYPAGPQNETYLIHCACLWGRPKFVKLLLENGADPSRKDFTGSDCIYLTLDSEDDKNVISIIELLHLHKPSLFFEQDELLEYALKRERDKRIIEAIKRGGPKANDSATKETKNHASKISLGPVRRFV